MVKYISCYKCNDLGRTSNVCTCGDVSESPESSCSNAENPNRVDVERIRYLRGELNKINALKFDDIEFYEKGVKLHIDQEVLDDWKFIGMGNDGFIDMDFYLQGVVENEKQ